MRLLVLTAFAACTAVPAMASSIELISGTRTTNGSMVTLTCIDCPPLKPQEKSASYQVPTLEEGVQKEEIRIIDGQKVIVRTDRWMGGSPTVFFQKLSPEAEAAMNAKPVIGVGAPPVTAGVTPAAGPDTPPAAASDGIDPTATTAAVSDVPAKSTDDFSGFELRIK